MAAPGRLIVEVQLEPELLERLETLETQQQALAKTIGQILTELASLKAANQTQPKETK